MKGAWTSVNLLCVGDVGANLNEQKKAAIFSFYLDYILRII